MSESIAVLGSTGRTGLLCVKAILDAGYSCRAICRSSDKAYNVFSCIPKSQRSLLKVTEVPDIENVTTMKEAISGCSAVIFAACGVSFLGLFNRSGGPRHVDYGGVVTYLEAVKQLQSENQTFQAPKIVLISSLGVTRPYWPIHIMLNTFGGRVMTYKLRGEDVIRAAASDINYTIIRPGRLVPEEKYPKLKDSELIVDQGDKITGQILREDVARVAVYSAIHRDSGNKCTFELISAESGVETREEHRSNVEKAQFRGRDCSTLMVGLKMKNSENPVGAISVDINAATTAEGAIPNSELPKGTVSFVSSRSSLKSTSEDGSTTSCFSSSTADYSGSYRRRLIAKKVAVMSDGKFTVECPDVTCTDAASGVPRRHPLCISAGGLISSYHPEVKTLYESFKLSATRNSNNPLFGSRRRGEDGKFGDYQWKTYGEVYELVEKLS